MSLYCTTSALYNTFSDTLSTIQSEPPVAEGTLWDGAQLNAVAFFDTPLHTVTINVVKNFILLGGQGGASLTLA